MQQNAGPEPGRAGAGKSLIFRIPPNSLTRKDFVRICIGRIITGAVIVADAIGSERTVDTLLRAKDRINKRGRV